VLFSHCISATVSEKDWDSNSCYRAPFQVEIEGDDEKKGKPVCKMF